MLNNFPIFFFNDTATTEIYTLSLHDALPIYDGLLAAHIRGEGKSLIPSIREVLWIAERYGCPLQISHLKAAGRSNWRDRKSTRLNSSHANISYAVFCLKKKQTVPLSSRMSCH